jgi:Tol biopolymer transport system component
LSITVGTHLGSYEITSLLGKGGMGEVYRARDAKLKRDVAIKILPDEFSRDADRVIRFQREAEVLASLNHPNVAAIYDLQEANDTRFLVLELVEGETLADRIARGPIPVEEALDIAKHICEALEAAHERGIIHRDLKPANVKITPDGKVKVLDFGLAKIPEAQTVTDFSNSPTLMSGSAPGMILGTAAYMSPEQARGKTVDKRTDIWAFGAVVYEMLAGKPAFTGETVSDTLIEVATKQPDWKRIPATPGRNVQRLLRRCLEKDPKRRLRDIGEAWFLLEDSAEQPEVAVPAPRHRRWSWIVATGVTTVAALVSLPLAFVHFREKPSAPELVRFQIAAPGSGTAVGGAYVSPDGRRIAISATGADGRTTLWVRTLDALDSRPLAATEGLGSPPFWSPDSRFIAFFVAGKLKKVEVTGGPAQTVCDAPDLWRGGAWSREGVIIFGTNQGLMRVSEAGGIVSPLTKLDSSRRELFHGSPSFLPDGRRFIYLRASTGENSGIFLGSLDAKPEQQNAKRLIPAGSPAVYASYQDPGSVGSRIGHVLFAREGSLMAQAFDARQLELAGEAVPIAENLRSDAGVPRFSVSTTGVLAYQTGGIGVGTPITQLTWFDRTGKTLGTVGEPGQYNTLALSPDGTRVAFSRVSAQTGEISGRPPNHDLWVHEFARNTSTQITFDPAINWQAVWSADGSHIVFASDRDGPFNLYQKDSSGAGKEDLLFKSSEGKFPYDWSPDGRFLLYVNTTTGLRGNLWVLPLTGDDRKPVRYLQIDANESHARFSPDGRFVAYTSNGSGLNDVFVQPFPLASGGKWKIGSGSQPHWRRDGKELYYISNDSKIMAVDIATNPAFRVGTPTVLFPVPIWAGARFVSRYDVSADGKKFLINTLAAEPILTASTSITVVLNWDAGLKK